MVLLFFAELNSRFKKYFIAFLTYNTTTKMWKTFTNDDHIYMLKVVDSDNNFEIYLSDLMTMWNCILSQEALVQKFQECNPAIEQTPEEYIQHAKNILNEVENAEVGVICDEGPCSVRFYIKTHLATNFKFKLKLELDFAQAEEESFTEKMTVPLIQTIILLEKQQEMMRNLLLKKDRELEEYKMEKGEISRSDLITEKFNPESLIASSKTLMLNVFQNRAEDIKRKYGAIEEKVEEVEVESWNSVKRRRKIYNKETANRTKDVEIKYNGGTNIKQEN
ncbi:uncharacterized protein LOC126879126 [Diabrotica virgifera virgifera]|uniref:Non-homologous end-joining factor 1 n=1 Tax=Diabrotica virgifera virgifera TaxID=50390 RepID=A0ABM5JJC2_DIAVI|nr:uncharacterized protein LOC126879126 [Diabrotica virgifera virgifera]